MTLVAWMQEYAAIVDEDSLYTRVLLAFIREREELVRCEPIRQIAFRHVLDDTSRVPIRGLRDFMKFYFHATRGTPALRKFYKVSISRQFTQNNAIAPRRQRTIAELYAQGGSMPELANRGFAADEVQRVDGLRGQFRNVCRPLPKMFWMRWRNYLSQKRSRI